MIDDLKAIAIFAETVRQGSFRKAAQTLNLSPSVVSYHVSQLERRTGNALLYRSTRKLSLTNEGKILYQHAQQMLLSAKTGLSEISPNNHTPSGKLKLTLPAVLSSSLITKKITLFCNQYPEIEISIISSDERQNIIQDGIDLAIRIGKMQDSNLKAKHLFDIKRKLVCSADYFHKHVPPKKPEALSNWHWIKLSMLPAERTLYKSKKEYISIHYDKFTSVNSVELMTQLCIHGGGLATPPDFLIDKLIKQGELIEIFTQWQVEPIPVYAVWPQNSFSNSNAMLFLKFINQGA